MLPNTEKHEKQSLHKVFHQNKHSVNHILVGLYYTITESLNKNRL